MTLRVLVVEDDPEDFALTRRALGQIDACTCDVRWTSSFAAGAEALRAGDLDVVLLDQQLGARTGLELIREVFGTELALPVVLLTGVADHETDVRASDAGVGTLLEKGALTPTTLERSIRYAMERSRAESELRSARTFFRAGFDALQEHVAILDADGLIVEVNAAWRAFAESNGVTARDSWSGTNYLAVCDAATGADSADSAEAASAASGIRAVLSGERASFQLQYPCHSDEQERWFQLRAVRFESEGRSLVYAAHIDVTERVLAERALRTSEGRYRRLVETSHEGICTVDATGCITYANGRLAEMLGYGVVDLAGWPIFTFMAPEAAFDARTRFARRARGISEVDEIPFLRRDGSTMWAWKSASTMFDEAGAFVGAVYVLSDITEHRSAQRRLAASERHFRALTEQSTELVTVLDPQGLIRYANPAWERLLGRPNDEAVGRSVFELVHPDDRAAVFAQFEALVREPGALVSVEYRAAHADGTWRVLQTVAHNLVGDPAVEGIVVNARDVTERRRAEDALRENEQRYRLLFERNPLPMYVADAETRRFLAVNDAAVAHYGYSREEFLSMLLDEIRPEEDRASFRSTFDTMLDGVASDTLRHQRRDGSLIYVMVTVDTVTFGDRPARLVASNDVTEPLRVEAQLRVARKQTELLLASAGEGIYALDADGRTTFVNPAAARLLGGRPDDILGADLHALLHHSHANGSEYDEGDCPIRRSLMDGTVHRVDTDVFWRLDGTSFPVEYVCTPLREDGRIVGVVVAFQDITQRRHLEMQLSQAQKMEAVGRLAGGVAHDFNNLLTVITSYTLMLLTELPAEDPVRPDLREIQAASERAAGLTRQLLAFSRQQVLSPRVIDLRQVVADTANMLRRLVGEDIELTIGGADGPTSVHADQGQIEQVVMNLAVNARDAMLSGGRLSIDVGAVTLSEASAERRVYVEPGEYVRVIVQDTGCGMDSATLEKIFDPFFTTKDAGKGTGLGLATVYGIVKQSGGYILVDSTPGEGTSFRIYLPRVAEMPEVREASAAETPALARMSATLLLAEDEDALRNITERLLRKRGYTVLCARDGEHALEVAAHHDGPIDLLVTDVVMPRMSGQELAERLTQRHGDIPVLFMTGYSMEAVANHGMLRPGARLLHKPFTPHDLALAASELLNATSNALRVSGEHRVLPTGEVL